MVSTFFVALMALALIAVLKPSKSGEIERIQDLACASLMLNSSNPDSVEIISISEPDSVFQGQPVPPEVLDAISDSLMNVNDKVSMQWAAAGKTIQNDPYLMELLSLSARAHTFLNAFPVSATKGPHNGWKVEVAYTTVMPSGHKICATHWAFIDKSGKIVFNSFDIPQL